MSVRDHQPTRPRRGLRNQLLIGQWWERKNDHAVFQLRNIWRVDKRVQLAPDLGGDPHSVTFTELRRDYRQVTGL